MNFKLEICVDSIESAINAQTAGADRVELCTNLPEGGTTPSSGAISSARDNLSIGLHIIIRPRGGDFLYSDSEFDIMRRDIEICGEYGADGIVTGILRKDGEIDTGRTAKLVEIAYPMQVTFHRAFDLCNDPVQGLEDIISAGASRLLTSGQKDKAIEGARLIQNLVKQAGSRIIIMPGSGLDETNITELAKITGASEFHMTANKIITSNLSLQADKITPGGLKGIPVFPGKIADTEKIKKIINLLKMI